MKTHQVLSTHLLSPGEKYDFFLFAPHAGDSNAWVPFIQKTCVRKNISCDLLHDYIKHEADIGSRELSIWIFEILKIQRPELKILLIIWEVPRAFCDLNRIPEIAIPEMVKREFWYEINYNVMQEIETYLSQAKYGLHIHTMNSRNNTINWNLHQNISENDIRNFLDFGYSWSLRNDNILTKHVNGNYHSFQELDNVFIKNWNAKNILLDKNIAYKFEAHFSATHLVSKIPSSLIEIVKWNLATSQTKDSIDASKIVLDKEKLQNYQELISQSIIEFLSFKK